MGYSVVVVVCLDDYSVDLLVKVYQVYQLFQNFGLGQEVNKCMNIVIWEVFQGKKFEGVVFDFSFIYVYENNGQLIQYFLFVYVVLGIEEVVFCWLVACYLVELVEVYILLFVLIGDELKL